MFILHLRGASIDITFYVSSFGTVTFLVDAVQISERQKLFSDFFSKECQISLTEISINVKEIFENQDIFPRPMQPQNYIFCNLADNTFILWKGRLERKPELAKGIVLMKRN